MGVQSYNKLYLYRIIHIDNLDYILNKGKLTCSNHPDRDVNYIGIGDTSLIEKRGRKEIEISPFGTFSDYIPFYFGNRSPMLYNIVNGFNQVQKRAQSEIIYLVGTFEKLIESKVKYVFFDGHGYHKISKCYNQESELNHIDWEIVKSNEWFDTEEEPERQRKKQAEILIYSEYPIQYLVGIGVYSEDVKQKLILKLKEKSINLPCIVKHNWYY